MTHHSTKGPVILDVVDGVATLQLHRPALNPIDTSMRNALIEGIRELSDDTSIVACVVHGGEENFAAGADIEELLAMDYPQIVEWNSRLQHAFTALAALPFPVIGAINGYALGGGLELALATDIRIGSTSCKVGLPEIKLGIIPGSGGTQRLTQIVGRSTAKHMMLTGRTLPASEAVEHGILDWSVEPSQVIPSAHELARTLGNCPRQAVRAIKESVNAALPIHPEGLALERSHLAGTFATIERQEAMEAFLARRTTWSRGDQDQ